MEEVFVRLKISLLDFLISTQYIKKPWEPCIIQSFGMVGLGPFLKRLSPILLKMSLDPG